MRRAAQEVSAELVGRVGVGERLTPEALGRLLELGSRRQGGAPRAGHSSSWIHGSVGLGKLEPSLSPTGFSGSPRWPSAPLWPGTALC